VRCVLPRRTVGCLTAAVGTQLLDERRFGNGVVYLRYDIG
jgi:hypothetical protein